MHKSYGILKIQDIVQYKQSKLIHSLLTEDKKLPAVLKKLIVPEKIFTTTKQDTKECFTKSNLVVL